MRDPNPPEQRVQLVTLAGLAQPARALGQRESVQVFHDHVPETIEEAAELVRARGESIPAALRMST